MLYKGETGRLLSTRFGAHRRAVIGNDTNQPVTTYLNSGNHSFSDMKIRILVAIYDPQKQEMRLKLGTVHPYGINGRFS